MVFDTAPNPISRSHNQYSEVVSRRPGTAMVAGAGSNCRTVVRPQHLIVPVIQDSLRMIAYAPAGSAATQASNLQECDS